METDGQQKQRLSERLKQKQASQVAEVEQLTMSELKRLNESLTKLVSDELSTTKAAISQQNDAINRLLAKQTRAVSQQEQVLEGMKQLTQSEVHHLRQALIERMGKVQSETIDRALAPMQRSLQQVKADGEALSRITAKAWLKPLLISLAITVGIGAGAAGIVGTMGLIYSKKIQQISALNQEIKEAKQTLSSLPSEIDFIVEEGKRFILAKDISGPYGIENGKHKGLMAVEIK